MGRAGFRVWIERLDHEDLRTDLLTVQISHRQALTLAQFLSERIRV